MADFTNRVVMITGAGGNLGQATARLFAAAGARLVLAGRNYEELEAAFPELNPGSDALFLVGDLTDENTVQGMILEVAETFERVDVLANIAGAYRPEPPVHEWSWPIWEFLISVNMRTVVNTCRAVVPLMLRQGSGKIVNVSARVALEGAARAGAYTISKSAVIRLTETMAAELKEAGVNVNCILPGTIDTPQNRANRPDEDFSRWVDPEAMAEVIFFLASDAARAIHGAAIPVYGLS